MSLKSDNNKQTKNSVPMDLRGKRVVENGLFALPGMIFLID